MRSLCAPTHTIFCAAHIPTARRRRRLTRPPRAHRRSAPLQESIRGCDVFIIQPTCPPVHDNLLELMQVADACLRASARTITAVVPYFGAPRRRSPLPPGDPFPLARALSACACAGTDGYACAARRGAPRPQATPAPTARATRGRPSPRSSWRTSSPSLGSTGSSASTCTAARRAHSPRPAAPARRFSPRGVFRVSAT